MLTEIYIEALLVNEDLADQVWEEWDKGEISDFWAAWAWWTIAQNKLEGSLCAQKRKLDGDNLHSLRFRLVHSTMETKAAMQPIFWGLLNGRFRVRIRTGFHRSWAQFGPTSRRTRPNNP